MYQNSHLEDYIQNLYSAWSIESPERINKYVIADRSNVGVYLSSESSEAFYWEERYYIFIDRNLGIKQRWQEFGHELCHVLRHSGHQGRMPAPLRELQEWQADNFMYHFCVPTFMLRSMRLPSDRYSATHLIAETFNVEFNFAEERLNRYLIKLHSSGFEFAKEQNDGY